MEAKSNKESKYLSHFFHLIVWVSLLIFVIEDGHFKILLIKRKKDPFKNKWSIIGDVLEENKSLEDEAKKVLRQIMESDKTYLEQLYTFSEPHREPRGRVLSVTYFTLLANKNIKNSTLHTNDIQWFGVNNLPDMSFDHKEIINYAVNRIKSKLGYSNIAKYLLPEKFRLSQLQKVYETILGEKLDKRNFIKKMKSYDLLTPLDERIKLGSHRPAQLYKFKEKELITFDK